MLAGNGVAVMIDRERGYTPTPVVSHAILRYNRGRTSGLADGIVITPSHNPPEDGGFKYNPPAGGPADTAITGWIEQTANALLADGLRAVRRMPYERARPPLGDHASARLPTPYVDDLGHVVDMPRIRSAGVRIGVDPFGGAGVRYWPPIVARYGIAVTVVNDAIDATFRFMTVDWDGKIRTDCSSPYAMAPVVALMARREQFDIAFANDPDHDRHGIVTPTAGLMNPNHYLAVAISYLFTHRPQWPIETAVGKTVVSSSMIDRVTAGLPRRLLEVPVGFKWFVDGFLTGSIAFGGEESAGASFQRVDGTTWTTDKDGIVPGLLAAEMTATLGVDPGARYLELTREFGEPVYERIDAPATPERATRFLGQTLPHARSTREGAGGRPHPRGPDDGARQRGRHRRPQSDHRRRMVCRAPLRDRGRVQAVRGELSRPRHISRPSIQAEAQLVTRKSSRTSPTGPPGSEKASTARRPDVRFVPSRPRANGRCSEAHRRRSLPGHRLFL